MTGVELGSIALDYPPCRQIYQEGDRYARDIENADSSTPVYMNHDDFLDTKTEENTVNHERNKGKDYLNLAQCSHAI